MQINQNKRFFIAGLILSLIVHCGLLLLFALSAFTSHGRFSVAPAQQQNKPLFFPTLVALLPPGNSQGSITPPPPALVALPDEPQAQVAPPLGSNSAPGVSAIPHAAEAAALMPSREDSENKTTNAVPSTTEQRSTPSLATESPETLAPSLHESSDATPPSLETLATEYEVVDQPLPTAYAVKEITLEKREHKTQKKSPPIPGEAKQPLAKKAKRKVTAEELKQLALASLLKEHRQASTPTKQTETTAQDNERSSFFSLAKKDLHQAVTAAYANQQGLYGDPNGVMDIQKSLKYYSYSKRIDSEHDAAVRREISKLGRVERMNMRPQGSAGIHLIINKEGYIATLAIIDSSGCPHFDRLIERAIMNGQPYSPIPEHLGIERYQPTGTRFITLN